MYQKVKYSPYQIFYIYIFWWIIKCVVILISKSSWNETNPILMCFYKSSAGTKRGNVLMLISVLGLRFCLKYKYNIEKLASVWLRCNSNNDSRRAGLLSRGRHHSNYSCTNWFILSVTTLRSTGTRDGWFPRVGRGGSGSDDVACLLNEDSSSVITRVNICTTGDCRGERQLRLWFGTMQFLWSSIHQLVRDCIYHLIVQPLFAFCFCISGNLTLVYCLIWIFIIFISEILNASKMVE